MEGPQVQLFVTCLVDSLAPEVGRASLSALEGAGCSVEFPLDQGCCGQPAFNVGLVEEARTMAGQTLDVLDGTEGPVVTPSGSCAVMMAHHYPDLFAGTRREEQARRVAGRVRELTQFLVDDLDADITASCEGCTVAYHYSCHGLRELGLSSQADSLLEGTNRVPLTEDDECCGFGGLFSVEMPAVSADILRTKLDHIVDSGATTLVGGDVSCLLHMAGGLRRRGIDIDVKHIAELLGDGE
ncbi:MAG: (Fe-S)-binding protein [Acidimicrobiia bacterium]|jgi:L-lactate dehydrogenase complex protein LldE